MKRILDVGREFGMEIIYAIIENLTSDGRDRSEVIDDVALKENDIWF
jgi:hypothetical protein